MHPRTSSLRTAAVVALVTISAAACGAAAPSAPVVVQSLSAHAGSPAASAAWTPWPQALFDAQHSGSAAVTGPHDGRIRWSRKLEGNVTPGPVVGADGTIYAASNAGVLHAIEPSTGKDRWKVDGHGSYGDDLSTSPAVLPNGLILWPGPNDDVVAVSTAGKVRWRLHLAGQPTSPAVLPDGTVAIGSKAGDVEVLSPTADGPGVIWTVHLDGDSYGSVAWSPDGRTVYDTLLSGAAVALRDGEQVWRRELHEKIEVSPAVSPQGIVVIGTNGPHEFGLEPADGSIAWSYRRGRTTYSSPVVTGDGIAYFGDHANRVVGIDAATGRRVFGYDGPAGREIQIWTSVAVDKDHTVFAGSRDGRIYAADRDGRRLWSLDVGANVDSYPALTADGALVIGVTDGTLLSIADR